MKALIDIAQTRGHEALRPQVESGIFLHIFLHGKKPRRRGPRPGSVRWAGHRNVNEVAEPRAEREQSGRIPPKGGGLSGQMSITRTRLLN